MRKDNLRSHWQGVRADESRARANLTEREDDPDLWGLSIYRPILNWSVDDVFALHRKHKVKPNPLYKLGMGRVGCMPCIHARKSEIREIANRFEDQITKIAYWEKLVSDVSKQGHVSFFSADKTPPLKEATQWEQFCRSTVHKVVVWSRTGKGGRVEDDNPLEVKSCQSLYGLCE